MRPRLTFGILLTTAALVALVASDARAQDQPTSGQRLALYTKPAVVRVVGVYIGEFKFNNRVWRESIGGSGSGFFISPDGYIATNAHVVEAIQMGDDKAKEALRTEALKDIVNTYKDDLRKLPEDKIRQVLNTVEMTGMAKKAFVILSLDEHPNYDIKAYGAPVGEGKDCAIIKISTKNAPTLSVGDSTRVQLQDKIYVIGYPGVADIAGVLDEKSQLESSITDGSVSAVKNTQDGDQVIQVTAPISHGNSGGPAVNENGEVIGLLTFGSAKEVQGFNFLVSSQTLLEFVRQAGTTNTRGETDKAWHDALDLYWDRRYTTSIEKLEEVTSMYPAHGEAKKILSQARDLRRQGKERGGAPIAIILIVGAVVAGGSGLTVWQWQRRRRPAAVPPPPFARPAGASPAPPQLPPSRASSQPVPIADTMAVSPGVAGGGVPETMFVAGRLGTLTCTRGVLAGQRFSVNAGGLLVGRQPGVAHILIQDGRASGEHVWIRWEDGKLVAIDQSTTNGTFVNDMQHRISRAELKDGDVLIVADPECLSLTVKIG